MSNRLTIKIKVNTIDNIPLARIYSRFPRSPQPATEATPFHQCIKNISKQKLAIMLDYLYRKKHEYMKERKVKRQMMYKFSLYQDIVILSVFKVNQDQLFNKETQLLLETLELLLKRSQQAIDRRCNTVLIGLRNKDIDYLLRVNMKEQMQQNKNNSAAIKQVIDKRVELVYKYIEGRQIQGNKLKLEEESQQSSKSIVDILREEDEVIAPERSTQTGFSRIQQLKQNFYNFSNNISNVSNNTLNSFNSLNEGFHQSEINDTSLEILTKRWKEIQHIQTKECSHRQKQISIILKKQGIDSSNFSKQASKYESFLKKNQLKSFNISSTIN